MMPKKLLILLFAIAPLSMSIAAQETKIAYINSQEIFNAMKQELKIKLDLFSPNDLTSAKIDNIINQIVKIQ